MLNRSKMRSPSFPSLEGRTNLRPADREPGIIPGDTTRESE